MSFADLTSHPPVELKDDESYLFMSALNNEIDCNTWNYYLNFLPSRLQNEVNTYRRWQDRQNCLLGKLLVYSGYYLLYHKKLDFKLFWKDSNGKPFIRGGRYQFNISHTDNMVACVFSKQSIGIDVEQMKDIDFNIFDTVFSWEEMQEIRRQGQLKFYHYWTTKEAVTKALGKGMSIPLLNIKMAGNHATFANIKWFTNRLLWNGNYCTVVSASSKNRTMIKEIKF